MVRLEIPLKAIPKGRPRSGKQGHFYTPSATRDFETASSWYLREQYRDDPLTGKLNVTMLLYGNPRGDLDNLAKSVLDAAQGIIFKNDSQIDDLWIRREKKKIDMILMLVEQRE